MIDKVEFWLGVTLIVAFLSALFVVDYAYSRNAEQEIIQTCKEVR